MEDLIFEEEDELFGTSEYRLVRMALIRAEVLARQTRSQKDKLRNMRRAMGHRKMPVDYQAWNPQWNPYAGLDQATEKSQSQTVQCFFCHRSEPFAPLVKIAQGKYAHRFGETMCADLYGRGGL
jgi:hypothetical protein